VKLAFASARGKRFCAHLDIEPLCPLDLLPCALDLGIPLQGREDRFVERETRHAGPSLNGLRPGEDRKRH
jgi:hypothetical protein